jgi:hypothetical protein
MAILARCPTCKRYQSAKNKRCKCSEDLDAAKRAGRVNYSIQFRQPDGKLVKRSLKKEGLDSKSIKKRAWILNQLKMPEMQMPNML